MSLSYYKISFEYSTEYGIEEEVIYAFYYRTTDVTAFFRADGGYVMLSHNTDEYYSKLAKVLEFKEDPDIIYEEISREDLPDSIK